MSWSEKNFEEKMTKHIDDIYHGLFSNLREIKRSNRDNNGDTKTMFMDKELAIDTFIHFKDGSFITLQEKTRRFSYLKYNDFTFEYYNDPNTGEKGEWFKCAAQYYFYGYANENEDGYHKYWIIDVPKMRVHLKKKIGIKNLVKNHLQNNRPPAKANFFAIPFDKFSKDCIFYEMTVA